MEKSMPVARPRSFTLGTSTIGSQNWQNSTLRDIKLSQTVVGRSDKNCDAGRSFDPLPNVRDTVAELSNFEAHKYFREVQAIVTRLQESLLDLNEEIKSLTRGKESLEKALEHRRKDIQLNRDSIGLRSARPSKERDIDGADDLLNAERQHLLNLKRSLETHLKSVQNHLQALNAARGRVSRCLKERSRVLDLVCHTRSSGDSGRNTPASGRASSRQGGISVDPLGAFTPEAEQALREANEAKKESRKLRSESYDIINRTDQLRQAALQSVNSGLRNKVYETDALKGQLALNSGHTRNAMNRAQRWYDTTDMSRGYHLGPVSSADMTSRERLTRPVIRVYQRHPGTQLPEAQLVINSGAGLDDSLLATRQNIELLRLTQGRLHDNIKNKQQAAHVDRSVLRMRRRKADHRWTLGQA